MKIKSFDVNYRKGGVTIVIPKGEYFYPFVKMPGSPATVNNRIVDIYIDKELGSQWLTYTLESGFSGEIPIDAFLEYNGDPDFFRDLFLYKLTLQVLDAIEASGLSKREIARKLHTSPAQLYRLLDPANYQKTVDQMFKLLVSLGFDLDRVVDEIGIGLQEVK